VNDKIRAVKFLVSYHEISGICDTHFSDHIGDEESPADRRTYKLRKQYLKET